jgi:hypothetical protein
MKHIRIFVFVSLLSFLVAPSLAGAVDSFPGSTWGELRWEGPTHGQGDLILYGWVKQGIELKRWSPDARLSSYVTVRYKWDTQELDWNNYLAPGGGIAFDTYLGKQFPITIGAEYLWERYYKSSTSQQRVVLYMNWYGWWDLKKP